MITARIPISADASSRRKVVSVWVFALGAFAIGTGEFATMGLLNVMAGDLTVTVHRAGTIVSAYALGVVVGAPVIALLSGQIPRRGLIMAITGLVALGMALTALAPTFSTVVAARFVAGLPHGAYYSVAGLVAAHLADPGRRGRSVAVMYFGIAAASVAGVPVSQLIGAHFGWHAAYWLVAAMAIVTLFGIWFFMPHMERMPATNPREELVALTLPQVWLTLAIAAIGFGGMVAVYAYITFTLTERAGLNPDLIWVALVAAGIGKIIGNAIGGRLADWNLDKGILVSLGALAVSLFLFIPASTHPVTAILGFALIGCTAVSLLPALQLRLMDTAGKAQTLANALNHAALNFANASGAYLGGVALAHGYGYGAPATIGGILATFAIIIWFPAHFLFGGPTHPAAATPEEHVTA